ncbi:MAG: low molecular weight phosphatase family protein [Candidatus Dadabacteria bacterium]
MAEALLRALYEDRYDICSAGTGPSRVINPYAIMVMVEIDVDISVKHSKCVDDFKEMNFYYVVTLSDHAKESCPLFPEHDVYLHHHFEDPTDFDGAGKEILVHFRQVRNKTRDWIEKTLGEEAEAAVDKLRGI